MRRHYSINRSGQASLPPVPSGLLQRRCACGNHAMSGGCEECTNRRGTALQRFPSSAKGETWADGVPVPPIVHEVLRSHGRPLDTGARAVFEPYFGHDFSRVRVHTDTKAAESARSVNALAYTVGRNVVFRTGRYAPGTESGKRLLAHELAHVVQQNGKAFDGSSEPRLARAHHVLEQQAEAVSTLSYAGAAPVAENLQVPMLQRVIEPGSAQTVTGTNESENECAGWFSDHESTSKRAAEHYVRTELVGDRGVVERIECDLFNPDTGAFACTVHFTDGTPIRVIVRRDAIIVGVYPLQTMHPPPDRPLCWYDYRCPGPNRDLVLTKRKCQTSKPAGGAPPPKTHGPEP